MSKTSGGGEVGNDTVVVTITNETKSVSLNVTLPEVKGPSQALDGNFEKHFSIVEANPGADEIAVDHGDILSATYTTETGIVMNLRNYHCFETLEVDTQGPTFSNRIPLNLTQSASQSVILQVDIEDISGIEVVAFYLDGEIVQPTKVVQTLESAFGGLYTKHIASLHLTLPPEVYEWSVTATDKLGNISTTEHFTFEVQ
jgi:hypothetical protein